MHSGSFEADRVLLWPGARDVRRHAAEVSGLVRAGKRAWVVLPATALETRYRLCAAEESFGESERATAIQGRLQQRETAFGRSYLIATPGAAASCYNITDYVRRCVAGDLAIAERLRGRTVIHLAEQEVEADDLLVPHGVAAFVKRMLVPYLETYGKKHLVGFSCELPGFLSLANVLRTDARSMPWSPVLLETMGAETATEATEGLASYLPLVFYETYNSAAVRNRFWGELTRRFATYFLRGVRDFCHQERLGLGLSVPASTRTLGYELGTLLGEVDCPVLDVAEIDTPRRFVVAKWVCSRTQQTCISRRAADKADKTESSTVFEDMSFGFNVWLGRRSMGVSKARGYPKRPLLMVAPTQSFWTKPHEKEWNGVTKAWGRLCEYVWALGYDFRIVSEQELGSAEMVKAGKRGIRLPKDPAVYNVILLPSCISLQEETVTCLRAFTKAKGRLIADEPIPYLLNGRIGLEPYPLERLLYGRRTTLLRGPENEKLLKLEKCLKKWVEPSAAVYMKPGNEETRAVQVHHRVGEDSEVFYLFNTGAERIDGLVELRRQYAGVMECGLFEEAEHRIDFWHANGQTYFECVFDEKQGRLFVAS